LENVPCTITVYQKVYCYEHQPFYIAAPLITKAYLSSVAFDVAVVQTKTGLMSSLGRESRQQAFSFSKRHFCYPVPLVEWIRPIAFKNRYSRSNRVASERSWTFRLFYPTNCYVLLSVKISIGTGCCYEHFADWGYFKWIPACLYLQWLIRQKKTNSNFEFSIKRTLW